MTSVRDGDDTTASTADASSTDAPEAFARLRMEGDRFDGAQLPVEALVEIQRYQALILKSAEYAWTTANPDVDLPADFAEGSKLVISDVEDGSAVSVLARPAQTRYDEYYVLGREELEREIEVISTWLASTTSERAQIDPVSLPLLAEPALVELGSSFAPSEHFTIASPSMDQPVELTERLRKEAIAPLAAERAQIVKPAAIADVWLSVPGDVAGRLFGVNAERKNFEMGTLRFGEIHGRYREDDLTTDLRKVLDNTTKAPVIRVTGELRYKNGVLQQLLSVTSVQRLEIDGESWSSRFVELASLDNGWDPDNPDSNPVVFASLEAAREILAESKRIGRPLPGIFPMDDGGVQLEWASAEHVTSIEISPGIEFQLFDLEVITQSVVEETTIDLATVKEFVERTVR